MTFDNPDFVKYAEAYGAKGTRVSAIGELQSILRKRLPTKACISSSCRSTTRRMRGSSSMNSENGWLGDLSDGSGGESRSAGRPAAGATNNSRPRRRPALRPLARWRAAQARDVRRLACWAGFAAATAALTQRRVHAAPPINGSL